MNGYGLDDKTWQLARVLGEINKQPPGQMVEMAQDIRRALLDRGFKLEYVSKGQKVA